MSLLPAVSLSDLTTPDQYKNHWLINQSNKLEFIFAHLTMAVPSRDREKELRSAARIK